MVKIIVDKIDGHIVYLRYFEEMDGLRYHRRGEEEKVRLR